MTVDFNKSIKSQIDDTKRQERNLEEEYKYFHNQTPRKKSNFEKSIENFDKKLDELYQKDNIYSKFRVSDVRKDTYSKINYLKKIFNLPDNTLKFQEEFLEYLGNPDGLIAGRGFTEKVDSLGLTGEFNNFISKKYFK